MIYSADRIPIGGVPQEDMACGLKGIENELNNIYNLMLTSVLSFILTSIIPPNFFLVIYISTSKSWASFSCVGVDC